MKRSRDGARAVYFLDATALVDIISNAKGTSRLRRELRRDRCFKTTWLCVAEAYGVLKRRLKKEIGEGVYHYSLFDLRCWIDEGRIEVLKDWLLPGTRTVHEGHEVEHLARNHHLDFSDAIQLFEMKKGTLVAAAGASEAVLISSDAGLLAAAQAEGFKVWNPEVDQDPPD